MEKKKRKKNFDLNILEGNVDEEFFRFKNHDSE